MFDPRAIILQQLCYGSKMFRFINIFLFRASNLYPVHATILANQMALLPGMVPKCKWRVVEFVIHITSDGEFSIFLFLLLFPLAVHC